MASVPAMDLIRHARQQAANLPTVPLHPVHHGLPNLAIDGYTDLREIHRGGQGIVYKARQNATGKLVAIKVLRGGQLFDRLDRARFRREIHALAHFRHPNKVTLLDGGTIGDLPYLVTEYIDGRPLHDYLRDADPPLEDLLRLFVTICRTVAAAHAKGIIHRDLKPGNIIVDNDGQPHVLDFGLARLLEADQAEPGAACTVTGEFVGTLAWASPEQVEASSGGIDVRTDVYALGLILFHMLTRQMPYEVVAPPRQVFRNVLECEPIRPSSVQPDISRDLDAVVLKALSKRPADRYEGPAALADDVENYLAGRPVRARRLTRRYVLWKAIRRRPLLAAFVALVLFGSIGYTVSVTYLFRRATAAEGQAEANARQADERAQQLQEIVQTLIGDVSKRLERISGAAETRQLILDSAFRQLQTLGSPESDDPEFLGRWADTHRALGDHAASAGLLDDARRHLEESLATRRRLVEMLPSDLEQKAKYSIALVRVGDMARNRADDSVAERYYLEALALDEELVAAAPANLHFLDNLLWSYERLGWLAFRRHAWGEAQDWFDKQAVMAAELVERDPANPLRLYAKYSADSTQAQLATARRDWPTLIDYSQRCREVMQQLLALEPHNPDYRQKLAAAILSEAIGHVEGENPALGRPLIDDALEILRGLAEENPDVATHAEGVLRAHDLATRVAMKQQNWDLAADLAEQRIETTGQLVERFPQKPRFHSERYFALTTAALLAGKLARPDEAEEFLVHSYEVAEHAIAQDVADPEVIRHYGLALATQPPGNPDARNRGTVLLELAAERSGKRDPRILHSLATVYKRTGRDAEACELFRLALDLVHPGEPSLRAELIAEVEGCEEAP